MGKAFSVEERDDILVRLREIGLRLYAQKGVRGVSVREVTAQAGIAQGSFYSFYRDKEDFLFDLLDWRVQQKLSAMRADLSKSLSDPMNYLIDGFVREGLRLTHNLVFDQKISGTLELFDRMDASARERILGHYERHFEILFDFWRAQGLLVSANVPLLRALLFSAGVLIVNASRIGEYFPAIYRAHCEGGIRSAVSIDRLKV
ncbi:MAG: TetR/AcrR family transcriptional regulator [Clostridia bacterium]|nr:TetR/AcrR family transcriptional regulator [Clostridia bacterium]